MSRRLPTWTIATVVLLPMLSVGSPASASPPDAVGSVAVSAATPAGTSVGQGGSPFPNVPAGSLLVVNVDTGEILAARNPHLHLRPASTLKTLTAVTLMPVLDPKAKHTVTAGEMAPVYGSRAGLVVGGTYTIDDLWHGLLLPSGNDAAAALAGAYGGGRKTVAAMNARATQLQARDTKAVNPSGLDADGQYTSAYDLAIFARAALALPEFVKISGTKSYRLPGGKAGSGGFVIYGENRLLNHGFTGTIAGKTGYTTLAGRTFWVAARRGGPTMLVTLMRIGGPTEDAAKKVMTWALANAGRTQPLATLPPPLPDPSGATPAPSAPTATASGEPNNVVAAGLSGSIAATSGSTRWPLVLGFLAVLAAAAAVLLRRRRPPQSRDQVPPPSDPGGPSGQPTTAAQGDGPSTAPQKRITGNVRIVPTAPRPPQPPDPT